MKRVVLAAIGCLLVFPCPSLAQDGFAENIVVTGTRLRSVAPVPAAERRPVIGIRRQADSALRSVEITSDSLDDGLRRREVRAMLYDAIDRARSQGFNVVTGQFTVKEVTRENWKELFPDLAKGSDSDYSDEDESWQDEDGGDDEDSDEDQDDRPRPAFADDGSTTTLRLMIKTRLEGSIDRADREIGRFVKSVRETGRSQMKPKGSMALTIIKPEQYRDELYRLIAAGARHAAGFYGPEYGLEVTGLHGDVAWEQVSESELFVFIRYGFVIKK